MPWWTEEEFGLSLVISLLLRGTNRESMLLCVPFEKGGKDSMISSHLYLLCKWDVTIFFQNSFAVCLLQLLKEDIVRKTRFTFSLLRICM